MKKMLFTMALCLFANAAMSEEKADKLVSQRPPVEQRLFRSEVIERKIREVKKALKDYPKLAWMFENCFPNTLDTTVHYRKLDNGDDDTFVYTGDIHAMWLRDSGAQVWPYVIFANDDPQLKSLIRGVILRQLKCINLDPYANAFNDGPTGSEWESDYTKMIPELHERKYEIDSLCYPIRLAYHYWQITGDDSFLRTTVWKDAVENILRTFREQQRREGQGSYRFMRKTERALDTVQNDGYGHPVKPCGLIASMFRPSDDACTFPFLIPSNLFAVSILRKIAKMDDGFAQACNQLADEVEKAVKDYGVVNHPKYGRIYAYEVDGFGNQLMMDDANIPSLLSLPYIADIDIEDTIYQNTRRFVLSEDNPYFFCGSAAEGIGGPHIGPGYIWPMSIIMRALTSQDEKEMKKCLDWLQHTDGGTGFMHESFDKDHPEKYTRKWFAWANTLFGELILKVLDEHQQVLYIQ
ncbi:MAG: glycoside hydrolase family 125 protein [Prevotella sp.]|nr:glycoside hydrolase family 125 protein [Prevotella sp.]